MFKRIALVLIILAVVTVGVNAEFERINNYNSNFADVADTSWYAENVKTAYELGFMNGKSENTFDPDGNVTVAEGITMASRLHAIYNGTEVSNDTVAKKEVRFDFDSMKNVGFNRAFGESKGGILVCQPDKPNSVGNYDPGVFLKNLNIDAREFDKITVRMKRDYLDNTDPSKRNPEISQIYFSTSESPVIDANKFVSVKLNEIPNLAEWFEIEFEFASHKLWKGIINQIRFDPADNNGVYYVDSIVFSKSDKSEYNKWYDIYVNYAVQNGIIADDIYNEDDYVRNIKRAELCDIFASALPEEYYSPVNNIKGIPDVDRDSKNADVYLMLYKAGVLLGSDEEGSFNPDSDILRSEVAAIINRVALPESRVKGTISAEWHSGEHDIEFDDEKLTEGIVVGDADYALNGKGAVVLTATDRGENRKPRYAPKITAKNVNIDAEKYTKLVVRMKMDYIGQVTSSNFSFYFKTAEDADFSEMKVMHQTFGEFSYVDPAGWHIIEIDFKLNPKWDGIITDFRFDAGNTNGVYTIDYIRFVESDVLYNASHEQLVAEGFTETRILYDEGFERGFYVMKYDQSVSSTGHGKFTDYVEAEGAPLWGIAPYWAKYDLWEHRDTTTDKYTLTDTYGINTIKYNPEEKSILMRLNATKNYNGEPHIKDEYKWWPHLLLDQKTEFAAIDKQRNSIAADRLFVETDIRLLDFKDTINSEGSNVCSYFIYLYLMTDKAPGQRIWFGLTIFNGLDANDRVKIIWSPDSAANQYMYGMPPAVVFGNTENSFNPAPGVAAVSDEWKHIRLDITPHVERAIEWANRDNIFGVQISKEDMYVGGANIGFEIHGNFDCTFEFKNFNVISYSKED